MGGHLPSGKEYLDPDVSTCPPSEHCTIYPVPIVVKPDICETVTRHPLEITNDLALPLCTFADDYTVFYIVLF